MRTLNEVRASSESKSGAAKSGAANATLGRGIDILLAFTEEQPTWTAVEIAAHFDMPRSTAYRYINALRSYALLVGGESGGYRLGPKIFSLARVAKASTSVLTIATPHLVELNEKFGESVTLYERIGSEMVALDRVESRHRVRISYARGQLLPWPAAASAKVLLAYADREEQSAMLRLMEPVRYTKKTVGGLKTLRRALDDIRKHGYAYSDQERDDGVRGIAAPIFTGDKACYCVTLSGPTFRLTDDKIAQIVSAVKTTASKISEALEKTEY